jgi:2-dehydro-3-deoxyphosphooctonate aldolase (KDO 8-P synthase)
LRKTVKIGNVTFGGPSLGFIAGPCVIESPDLLRRTAEGMLKVADQLKIKFVFKCSFDKANRTRLPNFRGPGFYEGLRILQMVKEEFGLPILSDVHETWQVAPAAEVLDALQIPAFLARQTDLLVCAAESGLPVNVKKGQFMAPDDMALVASKMEAQPNFKGVCLCERGSCFGYHNLVVDMRALVDMRVSGWPVLYDATHSVQQRPEAGAAATLGIRRFIAPLARAAAAAGVDGFFLETHPRPDQAQCDSGTQWPLNRLKDLIEPLIAIHELSKGDPQHEL